MGPLLRKLQLESDRFGLQAVVLISWAKYRSVRHKVAMSTARAPVGWLLIGLFAAFLLSAVVRYGFRWIGDETWIGIFLVCFGLIGLLGYVRAGLELREVRAVLSEERTILIAPPPGTRSIDLIRFARSDRVIHLLAIAAATTELGVIPVIAWSVSRGAFVVMAIALLASMLGLGCLMALPVVLRPRYQRLRHLLLTEPIPYCIWCGHEVVITSTKCPECGGPQVEVHTGSCDPAL